ncbi:cytochrome P450 [Smaragdicoccus niigatensis]|uniref:cytochrome P450 n=1 Tax=Smaragdicoccus niigatensis TaxID=359359 RepID=UPI000362CFC7|nr:cytochrome P450 [Smaragdicoccus niigatensis]
MPVLAAPDAKAAGLKPIPGDPGLPILGRSLEYLLGTFNYNADWYRRFGPVSWYRSFGITLVSVVGPEASKVVFKNSDRAYANEPGWSFFLGPFFKRGLLLLDFDEHLQNRRILQQAFTRDRLIGYLANMTPVMRDILGRWKAGQDFRVFPAVKNLTLNIASRTFVGEEVGPENDKVIQAFVDCVEATTAIVRAPIPGTLWWRGLRGREFLETYLKPRVAEARKADREDLLAALCHIEDEGGERFSDEDVINHMIFLLMAAHDTSTVTATAMIYQLAKHPEWQERCRAESEALGKAELEYGDLDKLASLDLVMKESIRITTPIPGVIRKTVKDTELVGYHVPKGSYVTVAMHTTHQLEDVWKNPKTFDPERHVRGEGKDAWMPFGGGVHKCIGMYFGGMEVKALLHQMLLNFTWSVPADYKLDMDYSSLPKPRDGLKISLVRR